MQSLGIFQVENIQGQTVDPQSDRLHVSQTWKMSISEEPQAHGTNYSCQNDTNPSNETW